MKSCYYIYSNCQTDYVPKGPFEERVQFFLHEYKEHREMGLLSSTICIEVGSDPHLPTTVQREGRDMVGILCSRSIQ